MDAPSHRPGPVVFDRYALDPDRRRLLRDGAPVELAGRAFELLAVLVARRGGAMSREELYQMLWPHGAVEDGNLTQNVYLLRRALDPAGNGRAFIETLPRYGYRFAMPVREAAPRTASAPRRARGFVAGMALATVVALLSGSASVRTADARLNPAASVAYSLGRYHLNLRTPADLRRSVGYFSRTVREAPESALGYAALASAYGLEAEFEPRGSAAFRQDILRAKRYRDAALQHDPASAEGHAVAGLLAYRFDGDRRAAENEFARALAVDPRNAAAHQWHAVLVFSRGEFGDAAAELELAHQLDPTSEVISRWLGRAYYYQRRPDDAIRTLSETLAIQPSDAPALLTLASAQEQRGRLREALATLRTARRRLPRADAFVIADEARLEHLLRDPAADPNTRTRIDRLVAQRRLDAAESALFYIALGLRDRAVTVLRSAPPASPIAAILLRSDPRFDAIRADPRFRRLGY